MEYSSDSANRASSWVSGILDPKSRIEGLVSVCKVSISASSPLFALWMNNDLENKMPPPQFVHLIRRLPKHMGQGSRCAILPSQSIVPFPEHSLHLCTPYPWHDVHSLTAFTLLRTAAKTAVPKVIDIMAMDEILDFNGCPPRIGMLPELV